MPKGEYAAGRHFHPSAPKAADTLKGEAASRCFLALGQSAPGSWRFLKFQRVPVGSGFTAWDSTG